MYCDISEVFKLEEADFEDNPLNKVKRQTYYDDYYTYDDNYDYDGKYIIYELFVLCGHTDT